MIDFPGRAPMSAIVDSTGLKICGQGEWGAQKHGDKKRKRWKKLHFGVDDEGCILASCMTDGHEQNPGQMPDLLLQINQEMTCFLANGIYDQAPVSAAVEDHSPGARVMIPSRENAVLNSMAGASPSQRDERIATIERDGVVAWKRTSSDDAQSHAENAFAQYKHLFGGACAPGVMSLRIGGR